MKHTCLILALITTAVASQAGAQPFAEPVAEPLTLAQPDPSLGEPDELTREPAAEAYGSNSTLRLHLGPVARISEHSPQGGLFAALDIGERAAGARLSGSWVHVGADHGMSQYAAELWVDFARESRLHPILGAGAGVARLDRVSSQTGEHSASTLGIGLLRGSLQYVLPVRHTDARASIEVIGSVPAIRGAESPSDGPWLLALASVGVGF
jgi:hypothetical protein